MRMAAVRAPPLDILAALAPPRPRCPPRPCQPWRPPSALALPRLPVVTSPPLLATQAGRRRGGVRLSRPRGEQPLGTGAGRAGLHGDVGVGRGGRLMCQRATRMTRKRNGGWNLLGNSTKVHACLVGRDGVCLTRADRNALVATHSQPHPKGKSGVRAARNVLLARPRRAVGGHTVVMKS